MKAPDSDTTRETRWSRLMVQTQDGEDRSYAQLLSEVSDILRTFIKMRIGNRDETEDVLQEVLLALHKKRHTYQPDRPFLPWLFAIARYKLADHERQDRRKKRTEAFFFSWRTAIADADDERRQAREEISGALRDLSEKQRGLLQMLKLDGYSVRQIAQRVDTSESAVKVAAHRALKALQKRFERGGDGEN